MAEITKIKIKRKQRNNLYILSEHLDKVDVQKFNMELYADATNISTADVDLSRDDADYPLSFLKSELYNACGTVACAAGHGPLAGVKPKKDETWQEYVIRSFGAGGHEAGKDSLWNWLFSDGWYYIDNTPQGAAARIRYYLVNHGIPTNNHGNMIEDIDIYAEYLREVPKTITVIEEPKEQE